MYTRVRKWTHSVIQFQSDLWRASSVTLLSTHETITKLSRLQVLFSSPSYSSLLIVGNIINRPSPHRSPVKLITFTSVFSLKARIAQAEERSIVGSMFHSTPFEILCIKKDWRLSNKIFACKKTWRDFLNKL